MTRRSFTLRRDGEEGTALRQYSTGGLSPYDSALRSDFTYVDIPLSVDETYLTTDPVGYDSITMYFIPYNVNAAALHAGTLDAYAIVRSTSGYPATNLDGVRVTTLDFSGSTTPMFNGVDERAYTIDRGLTPGRWYYYSLFARYQDSGNTIWVRVGISSALLPFPFGYKQRLWAMIPEYYRRLDSENVGSYVHGGVLQRFIEALGYEVDVHRTYAATIGDLRDINAAPAAMLPYIGECLGWRTEQAAGDKRFRKVLANLFHLRKISGTLDALEGWATAATGFPARGYVGKNIYLSSVDANFAGGSVGNWVAWNNCALTTGAWASVTSPQNTTSVPATVGNAGPAPSSGYVMYATASGASPEFGYGSSSTFNPNVALPVIAGHSYMATLDAAAPSGTPTMTMKFRWYKVDASDASGFSLISTTTDTAQGIATTRKRYANVAAVTAPALAVFCVPSVVTSNTTGACSFDSLMLHDLAWLPNGFPALAATGPTSAYEDPRKLFLNIYPNRANFALNSDFKVAYTGGWVTSNPTIYELLPTAYATYDDILRTPINNKALTSNVATLTTSRPHKLVVGQSVTVAGVDSTFNGTFTLTATTTNTFSYAKTAADVASTAVPGSSAYVTPGSEVSYNDLLAGYDTFATTTTFSVDSVNNWMLMDSHGASAPYLSQLSSAFFPVPRGTPHSARVQARGLTGAGTNMLLRYKWFTAPDPSTELVGTSVASAFTAMSLTTWNDVVIANAVPPAGANYARVVIESTNPTTAHQELVRKILIEDSAFPGDYFDGSFTDGEFGDYSFLGTAHQSFSVYMMQKNAMVAGYNGQDRISALLPSLVPPDRAIAINTPFSAVSLLS